MELTGQVAIVTGAGQGIGESVTELLSSRGASVVIVDRAKTNADRVVNSILSKGGKACAINVDLGKVESIPAIFDFCEQQYGKPDIFVSNAGAGIPPKPLEEITEEDYEITFNTNAKANLFILKEAKTRMNEGGRIVLVSSSSVVNPVPGIDIYIASKAAIMAMAQSTVTEFASRGITINTVLPGLTETPMVHDHSKDFLAAQAAMNPFGRLGNPIDVAEAIAFFCEKRSQWLTGQYVVAAGGSTT
ncbi:MAG: SDR family oxidoreductase [Parasporobacterium sp.]|nr:SDR family oxidoreductase [Parasporobacterium sp.]